MTWFKVDDGLHSHPKWLATPPAARALWVTAGSWCAAHLTDGRVPRHVLALLGGRPRDAVALVHIGLWEPDGDGWAFHDWPAFQPSAESVEAERRAARERQRRAREKATAGRGQSVTSRRMSRRDSRASNGASHGPPDPTRPTSSSPPPPTPAEQVDTPGAKAPRRRTTEPPILDDAGEYQPLDLEPVGRLAVDDLWPEMARRSWANRHAGDHAVPGTGRRLTAWLKATAGDLAERLSDRALEVIADATEGTPADAVIWELEPDLALRNWQIPDTPLELEPDDRCTAEEARALADAARARLTHGNLDT